MTQDENQHNQDSELPKSLVERLALFRQHLRHRKAWEFGLAAFLLSALSFLLFLALDRWMDCSPFVRGIFFGISAISILSAAPLWLYFWVIPYSLPDQIANLIAKHYPRMGDRLLGIIELQTHHLDNEAESASLRKAAVVVVANEIAARNLEEALPQSRAKYWAFGLGSCGIIIIVVAALSFNTLSNALARWAMPLAEITRYTSTQIRSSDLPGQKYCPINEPFSFTFRLTEKSSIPTAARARINGGSWIESPVTDKQFSFDFLPIISTSTIEIQVGDAQHKLEVQPYSRPKIVSATAELQYPSYLKRTTEIITLKAGNLKTLLGSRIQIELNPNRKISAASATIRESSESSTGTLLSVALNKDTLTLDTIDLAAKDQFIDIQLTDVYGLKNTTPYKIHLIGSADRPPMSQLQLHNAPEYILESDHLALDLVFSDDYGLAQTGISWSGQVDDSQPYRPSRGNIVLPNQRPKAQSQSLPFNFSLANFNIRPQSLTIRSWSKDQQPKNEKSYSSPLEIRVLSIAEHRDVIDQLSDDIIIALEECLQNELASYDSMRRLIKLDPVAFLAKEQRIDHYALRDDAARNQNLINQAQLLLDKLLKEANRNTSLKRKTLTTFAKATHNTHILGTKEMPAVLSEMSYSLQQAHQVEESIVHLERSIELQNKSIYNLERTIDLMHSAKRDLEVSSFVNRLKEASKNQNQISQSLVQSLLDSQLANTPIIGSEFEPLDPAQQRQLVSLYALHQDVSEKVRELLKDIQNYANRTQQKEYLNLVDEIEAIDVENRLESLSYELENNHNVLASLRAQDNAKLLERWAQQLLFSNAPSGAGAGGAGDSSSNLSDEDLEFMLQIMQIVKEQQQIREANRSINQLRTQSEEVQP
ncbi:hypothetical protein [Rubritalea marina]|uniref:hypothetical protein n=1 Tax=Rubritalea marina TaxID=361055 RepID=UPI00039A37FA|nr:hypothetical protein [Rubritalea marina]